MISDCNGRTDGRTTYCHITVCSALASRGKNCLYANPCVVLFIGEMHRCTKYRQNRGKRPNPISNPKSYPNPIPNPKPNPKCYCNRVRSSPMVLPPIKDILVHRCTSPMNKTTHPNCAGLPACRHFLIVYCLL